MTSISVIVPTHNRAESLDLTLTSLARQDFPASAYEVIIVADGCSDGTIQLLDNWQAPFTLIRIEHPSARGAAAARNAGAAAASSDLLLFLDDDMEASPQLLSEHVRSHTEHPGSVLLGHFPMQPPTPDDDVFTKAARIWWAGEFTRRSERGCRYTFRDLCTGNVSLAKSLFVDVGGFDEKIGLGAGEDYEFGYRLIRSGARFRFVRSAATIHHSTQSLHTNLRRAEQEGYGHAMMVRRHPELFWSFNISVLSRLADSIVLRPLWRAVWCWPALLVFPGFLLQAWVSLLSSAGFHSLLWRFHRPLRGYHYWRGVRDALGSLAVWERMAQDAPIEPPDTIEADLDVLHLADIDDWIGTRRIDALRVWYDGEPVGRVAPDPGAEPLRGEHVRNILIQRFTGVMLSMLTRRLGSGGVPAIAAPEPEDTQVSASRAEMP